MLKEVSWLTPLGLCSIIHLIRWNDSYCTAQLNALNNDYQGNSLGVKGVAIKSVFSLRKVFNPFLGPLFQQTRQARPSHSSRSSASTSWCRSPGKARTTTRWPSYCKRAKTSPTPSRRCLGSRTLIRPSKKGFSTSTPILCSGPSPKRSRAAARSASSSAGLTTTATFATRQAFQW